MAYKNHRVIILFSPAQVPSRRLYALQGTARHSGSRSTGKIPAAHDRDNQRFESTTTKRCQMNWDCCRKEENNPSSEVTLYETNRTELVPL